MAVLHSLNDGANNSLTSIHYEAEFCLVTNVKPCYLHMDLDIHVREYSKIFSSECLRIKLLIFFTNIGLKL